MARTVKEIEAILKNTNDLEVSENFLIEIKNDERKGVQLLYRKWLKEKEEEKKLKEKFEKMSNYEYKLHNENIYMIAGVDEVGRGPLAGPVIAAAVILGQDFFLPGLNDSKTISEKKRELFYQFIMEHAVSVGVGQATVAEIDELNIYQATKLAMKRAVNQLAIPPQYLLVDAMEIPVPIPQMAIIKGDASSVSIAASSIVAKVTRDRYMKELGETYPHYGFESHMGYGTAKHLESIKKYGVIQEHRRSFAPVRECLQLINQ